MYAVLLIWVLNFDIHWPPRLLWALVRHIGCTPISWDLKTIRVCVCWFHTNVQLLEKISSVVHCVIFILKTWFLSIIYRNFQTSSIESEIFAYLKIILLQAKHWWHTIKNGVEYKWTCLIFCNKMICFSYISSKCWSNFLCNYVKPVQLTDLKVLTLTLLMESCYYSSLTVSASFQISSLCMSGPSNMHPASGFM